MREWYVLQTKSRREESTAALLAQAQIETYLPMVSQPTRPGRSTGMAPFFSGYLFARLSVSAGEIRKARYTAGVLRIAGSGDEVWTVPDDLIALIRERVARMRDRKVYGARFEPQDRVIIIGGPLHGSEAIFDRQLSSAGRARVLIQILQRACPAEVHVGQLRLSQKAARHSRA